MKLVLVNNIYLTSMNLVQSPQQITNSLKYCLEIEEHFFMNSHAIG